MSMGHTVKFDALKGSGDDALAGGEEDRLVGVSEKTGDASGCLASPASEKDCHDKAKSSLGVRAGCGFEYHVKS